MYEMTKSPVQEYRVKAEDFYQTEEYKREADQLFRAITNRIRNKIIAIDLSGTLVCLNLNYHLYLSGDKKTSDLSASIDPYDRLLRPFANELLKTLVDCGNTVVLWTGDIREGAETMIRTSGLKVPTGVRLITLEQYLQRLHESRQYWSSIEGRFGSGYQEDTLRKLRIGKVKIPRAFGVDILLDDNADKDASVCEVLLGEDESKKFLQVQKFRLRETDDLYLHYRDRTLLVVAEQLSLFA